MFVLMAVAFSSGVSADDKVEQRVIDAPAGAQAAESGTDKDGFVPLFDGKTLNGWHSTGNWTVPRKVTSASRTKVCPSGTATCGSRS